MIDRAYVERVAAMSREELGDLMRQDEVLQGFQIISQAKWLDWNDWDRHTIISMDHNRVRLVALQAKVPGQGAFTRLIDALDKAGLVPVLVEPNQTLIDWCHRHFYRKRTLNKGRKYQHEVWYPKRCGY